MQCKSTGNTADSAPQERHFALKDLPIHNADCPTETAHSWWRWPVGGLFLLALALRVLSALMAHPLRPDSVYYIQTAENLVEGKFSLAFSGLGPNLYPAILIGLNQLGLDYETAGKLWGVIISTLTLLPLVGLVHALFRREVALISGFLYAVHPRFIEWGPELMRDPTFWFCFVMALYAIHKAYTNFRARWFLLSGLWFLAAIHLRIEGWLLLFPFGVLGVSQLRYPTVRRRLRPVAMAATLALIPVSLLICLNGTWSDEAPIWGRFHGMAELIQSKLASAQSSEHAVEDVRPIERQVIYFFKKCQKAIVPWLLIPAIVGAYCMRRRNWSLKYAAYWGIIPLNIGMVAAYLIVFGEINTRYFLTTTLLLIPYMSYGLVVIARRARRFWQSTRGEATTAKLVPAAISALLIIGGLRGVFVDRSSLKRQWSLGTWIRENCGTDTTVASWRQYSLVEYYANTSQTVLLSPHQQDWQKSLHSTTPDVVLANSTTPVGQTFSDYVRRHPEYGYRLVELPSNLPPNDVQVYVRTATQGTLARGPADSIK